MNRNQRKRRQQTPKPKGMGNSAYHEAMVEIRRSSATEPHRNRARYDRRDERNMRQKGWQD